MKGVATTIVLIVAIVAIGSIYFVTQKQQEIPSYQNKTVGQPFVQKCPDGICDEFEKANPNACPQDCGGSITQSTPTPTQQPEKTITVKSVNSKYKNVSSKPTGWFTTGQDADILLSGIDFNNAGESLLFNHPGNIASDGTHLILTDRGNNRVLRFSVH